MDRFAKIRAEVANIAGDQMCGTRSQGGGKNGPVFFGQGDAYCFWQGNTYGVGQRKVQRVGKRNTRRALAAGLAIRLAVGRIKELNASSQPRKPALLGLVSAVDSGLFQGIARRAKNRASQFPELKKARVWPVRGGEENVGIQKKTVHLY